MHITVTQAVPEDAGDLLAFLKQVGAETDNLSFGGEGVPFGEAEEAAFLAEIQNSEDAVMLVAKADGKIIGNASLNRMPRRMRHRGDVAVAVARDWWNCGVGSRFMSALIDFARSHQITVLDLQVRSDNHAAIHLYEKFGFQQIGVHPAFFRIDGRDIPFTMMCCTL